MIENLKNFLLPKDYGIILMKDNLYITNFERIKSISDQRIEIVLNDSILVVEGKSLKIQKLVDVETQINGQIINLEFLYK